MARRDGIQQASEGGGVKTMPSTRETALGSVVIVNNGHIHCTIFIESHPKTSSRPTSRGGGEEEPVAATGLQPRKSSVRQPQLGAPARKP